MSSRHPEERSIVITGAGLVSPFGIGVDAFWDGLQSGKSGISTLDVFNYLPVPDRQVGEVHDFSATKILQQREHKKALKTMCREIQMGVASAKVALDHASLDLSKEQPERVGVDFGANLMLSGPSDFKDGEAACLNGDDFDFTQWGTVGLSKMDPLWLLKFLPNMPACHIGINIDARGPNNSLTMDDAAGMLAMREAMRIITRGHADIMIAGSTGTRVHPMKTPQEILWGEVSPEPVCRPFDVRRKGMVIGEGACSLVLEEESHARSRGAKIYARLLGAGASCVRGPDEKGDIRRAVALAVRAALKDAGLTPDEVGHFNAHATGSPSGDLQEAQAIHDVFGKRGSELPVTALKSVFGNAGSGSSSVEFAASLLGVHHGVVPASQNCDQVDPACNLRLVNGRPLPVENKVFVKVSVTREGQAGAVVAQGL